MLTGDRGVEARVPLVLLAPEETPDGADAVAEPDEAGGGAIAPPVVAAAPAARLAWPALRPPCASVTAATQSHRSSSGSRAGSTSRGKAYLGANVDLECIDDDDTVAEAPP
jgi:hypothetical protein